MDRIGTHKALRPMLPGSAHLTAGYVALHHQEAKYTEIALREMPEPVAIWYRYLTLFDNALRREHDSPTLGPSDESQSWDLRLRLAGTAAGTAKLALDAGLAGYYSQAFALIRHMLETWRQMVYVRLLPHTAVRWFTTEQGTPPRVPNEATINGAIQTYARSSRDNELRNNINVVNNTIRECNKGAHPSELAAAQMQTGKPGFMQMGANYIEDQLAAVMSLGTVTLASLLDEIRRNVPVNEVWSTEFAEIADDRNGWHVRYFGNGPN